MVKPKGFYTKDEKVRPIMGRNHPHVKPLKKGTSRLRIPKRTVRQIQASRSPRARQIDARLKAKLAKDEAEWARQPNRRDLKGVDYPREQRVKTPQKQEQPKRHLEVLWTRNSRLKHKEFPLEKKEQAFNWYWRVSGDQIVLREEGKYGHSFSESDVSEFRQKRPTKEGYKQEFNIWLKDSLPEEKAKPKVHYEVIVGETVKSGTSASSLTDAEEQMKKLRKEKPTLRQMKIVKIEDGKFTDVKSEKYVKHHSTFSVKEVSPRKRRYTLGDNKGKAFVSLGTDGDKKEEGSAYIHRVDIKRGERGKAYGRHLVSCLENDLKRKGIKTVYIYSDYKSVGFWDKMGYKPYGDKPSDALNVREWNTRRKKSLILKRK